MTKNWIVHVKTWPNWRSSLNLWQTISSSVSIRSSWLMLSTSLTMENFCWRHWRYKYFSFWQDNLRISFVCLCAGSQKVVDGSGWNLVDRLGVWHGRINLIWWRSECGSGCENYLILKVILHHFRESAKNDVVLFGIFQKCIGSDMFS